MRKFVTLFIFLIIFAPLSVFAYDFSFDFGLGSRGEVVRELQKFLNKDSRTVVASSGLGSSGFETDYFGVKTYDAVLRFQNTYASEILIPNGLFAGTGFVGKATRQKINNINTLITKNISVPETTKVVSTNNVAINKDFSDNSNVKGLKTSKDIFIYSPASYNVRAGQDFVIYGQGFGEKNTIYFGDKYMLSNVAKSSSTTLKFTIPVALPNGWYDLKVGTQGLVSERGSFVVVGGDKKPKIISISPNPVSYGETVTITGENFSKNNQIKMYNEVVLAVSSDGKTISVKVDPYKDIPDRFWKSQGEVVLPLPIMVVSDGGYSDFFVVDVKI